MSKKILIVEDSPCQLEMMADHLSKSGYEIKKASNGLEAMKIIRSIQPDVVITDLVMPLMGGLDICQKLKKNPSTARIPVIVCTGKNCDVERFWAKRQGVIGYLNKPWTQRELTQTVELALRGKTKAEGICSKMLI